jgi:hypothetical protein
MEKMTAMARSKSGGAPLLVSWSITAENRIRKKRAEIMLVSRLLSDKPRFGIYGLERSHRLASGRLPLMLGSK